LTNALLWNVSATNQAPTITRVAPSGTNVTATPSQSITFQVNCADSDGNLKEVDWYVNGVFDQSTPVSGSAGSASWSTSFSTGTTTITAVAMDLLNLTNALVWNVSVTNQAPTITRVNPSGTNVTVAPGQSITFQVNCADPDGNLKEVDWYVNGVFDQSTPVSGFTNNASWSRSFSTGTTTITAVAVDMLSLTNGLVWNVSVTNQAPTITRVAPSGTNVTVAPGQSITFQVNCADSDGNLKEVDWYVNGVFDQSTPVSGSTNNASWSRSFSTGTTTIMAVAVDMLNLTNGLVWNVSATNQAPTITRVNPSGTNVTVAPGQSITFQVNCADSDGNLKEVDWYVNGVFDQATPVSGYTNNASWSRSFSTGTTTIMAVAVDMLNLTNALVWNVSVTNQAPTITRVAPSGTNVTVTPGQSITFQVNCADSDGNLKEVDWYVNGVFDQSTPVSGSTNNASWSRSFSTGTTTIMAVAVDMLNLSNALVWNVSATNQAPTITRVNPSGTNVTVAPGQSITFQVNCADSDGNLKEVDWYVNGVFDQSTPVSGYTNNASWSRSFSTGTTTIMAVAMDMLNLTNALVWNVSAGILAPSLTVRGEGANVVLSWPTNDPGFQLVSANNFAATNWNPVPIVPVIVNGQNTVTNSAVGAAQFYRLKK
jgi:N-formylglutamate amidohydrolase